MIKGEKILSYVKYYHEIESEYREKLAESKRKSDVREVFINILIKFLSNVDSSIDQSFAEYIEFDGESFRFKTPLKEKIEKLAKNSDLFPIIERIFESAKNRYLRIENDENSDYFNLKK
ncbi:hypothetical protein [Thermosipho atlanticus]|uniref:Uncharacterized protein n=1 Tax=Thermosipho atlanticus DSM 15807 TaxID=1123380 RepID=A0A1M5RUF7_9BACT|nr:hypothetical protein [Thermosipho atlanticus]SHH29884.1 hypothetical protein SAMN02745199_0629 [Thermosipho atlanticus DSM 15807]